jgi:uncharacterized protein (TIGR03435 family)
VEAFKGKPVQFLAITDENEAVVSRFLKQNPIRSWVGVDGVGQASRDLYGIQGIPTTVIVNQKGIVVAVTHPMLVQAKDIEEVLVTGKSSLFPLPENAANASPSPISVEQVPSIQPVFEVSARRSGPLPPGTGVDCWGASETSADATGGQASVRQAILTLFDGSETLLDCRTVLPTERYDFTVRLPPGATHADRERAVAPMFRAVFALEVRRVMVEREVYVLKVASTNAPGLSVSGPNSPKGGSSGHDGFKIGSTTIGAVPRNLEGWLHKPVVNETGLTNHYDLRLMWKLSKRESLRYGMDRQVLAMAEQPDATQEAKLSVGQRRQLDAIRGKLSDAEFQRLPAEDRENIALLRAELAKPEDDRFQPEPESVCVAVREQLGLALAPQRRSMPVLIVEKTDLAKRPRPLE